MRRPSYEAPAVKRELPRDRSKAELRVTGTALPVHPRIRSDRLIRTTIPGIREGQLQGGGTILRNGAQTGPGPTTAIRQPWIGARGRYPLTGRLPSVST
jgi:hypothetical protein